MLAKTFVVMWTPGIASMALPAFSQSETLGNNEVSVQAFGSFVKSTTTGTRVENKATDNGGVLASYRYFFNGHSGVEANYGYSLNTQNYTSVAEAVGVKSYSHELSAAYVFRMPTHKIAPFVLAGGGTLIFDPKDFAGASYQARASFVYGAGADFNVSQHVRAEWTASPIALNRRWGLDVGGDGQSFGVIFPRSGGAFRRSSFQASLLSDSGSRLREEQNVTANPYRGPTGPAPKGRNLDSRLARTLGHRRFGSEPAEFDCRTGGNTSRENHPQPRAGDGDRR